MAVDGDPGGEGIANPDPAGVVRSSAALSGGAPSGPVPSEGEVSASAMPATSDLGSQLRDIPLSVGVR
ncbi:MAG TPA: hypothetical protein VMD59_15120, partial [Acidimicrobiales bacterium]|nr:hypothetical protein [Acidimicrobiales bacterium]